MGSLEMAARASVIWGREVAKPESTRSLPSEPGRTRMLPPEPMRTLTFPRSFWVEILAVAPLARIWETASPAWAKRALGAKYAAAATVAEVVRKRRRESAVVAMVIGSSEVMMDARNVQQR